MSGSLRVCEQRGENGASVRRTVLGAVGSLGADDQPLAAAVPSVEAASSLGTFDGDSEGTYSS